MASLNNAIPFALLNNAIPFALLNNGATAIASGLGSCFAPRPTIRCISAGWQIAGATSSLLVRFLLPITSLLLGGILLDEAIMPEALPGMALIGLGLASIDGRLVARPALRGG